LEERESKGPGKTPLQQLLCLMIPRVRASEEALGTRRKKHHLDTT
jgi:hypothetical protein